jgi:hypothetical protein
MISKVYDLLDRSRSAENLETDPGVTTEDVTEDWELKSKEQGSECGVWVRESGVVELYPDEMIREELRIYEDIVQTSKEKEGQIERDDAERQVEQIKKLDLDEIDELVEYYDSLIPENDLELLENSIKLQRAAKDPEIILEKSIEYHIGNFAERYGSHATYINHLVSSGYFDQGGFFYQLRDDLEGVEGPTDIQYRDEYELLIQKELIAEYVSDDDNVNDIVLGVRSKIQQYFRYNPRTGFIDIRGLGPEFQEPIDETIEELIEEYGDLPNQDISSGQEVAVRIYPNALEFAM